MKTKLFTLFLALAASIGTVFGFSGTCGDNLTWDLTDGVLTISGSGDMTNWERNLDVPWHYFLENITRVTIPNSVTSIGDYAFYNCSRLTSVTIPNSVTSIGKWAFAYCTSLTSITIPLSVKKIGVSPFYGCSGLTSVVWNAKHCHDVLYNYRSPFYDIRSRIISCVFGEEVEHIPAYLCDNMTNLTSIMIPNSVTSIGGSAFYGCSGLTSVTIGNSVKTIGDFAFCDCSGLTSVTLPNSVTSIGNKVFYDCTGLTSVTIGNSVENIGNYAFADCSDLTNVTLNSNNIVSKAYTESSNIQSIFGTQVTVYIIGDDVTGIGDWAFYGCTGLMNVTIGHSVTSIGDHAFYKCSGLTSVTIPNSVTSIGYEAFSDCKALTSVTIGNSVTSIGSAAFSNCKALTSVTIGNNVTSIGSSAFACCSGLTSVTIPNSVTSIGECAFYYCTGLTSVTIGNSVTSIGYEAFYGCSGLTSVTLPNSVTSIGHGAFNGCSGLTSPVYNVHVFAYMPRSYLGAYTIPSGIESIAGSAFACCSGLTSVTIPNSVTSIGYGAFAYCTGLTSVTIPSSVTSIEKQAFDGCSGLKSITCNADVPPVCGYYTFNGVNKSIPLYVPAASMDAYQTADVWRDFTNIHTGTYYNVVFVDWDGTTLKSVQVEHRQAATAPKNPSRKGYTFVGWDKDFCNVTSDLTVTALYTINKYLVKFVDWDNTELKSETVEYGKSATAPANPSRDGYTFIGWDKEFTHVTSDMTVTAWYEQSEGIENIHINTSSATRKIIIDNVIYIQRGEELFNAQGARVK